MPLNIKCKDCRDFALAPNLPHKGVCKRMVLRSDPEEVRGCGCFYPASNSDRIRAMSDEELATWLTYNVFKNIDAFLNGLREQANISVSYPKDEKRLFENTLKWLKEEGQDGTL